VRVRDELRLLHKTRGYTVDPRRALPREPEALTVDQLAQVELRAGRRHRERQLADWRARRRELERSIDWLYAQRNQRDVRSQLRALQRQLDRLDETIRKAC
jgi:hypothetical protein